MIPIPNLVQLSLTVTQTKVLDRGLSVCSRPHVSGCHRTESAFGIRAVGLRLRSAVVLCGLILAEDTKSTFILPPRRPVNEAPGHWQGFSGCLVYSNPPAFPGTLQSVKW